MRAEYAFWAAKDETLKKEMFDFPAALARLRHQDLHQSFCLDMTSSSEEFASAMNKLEALMPVRRNQIDDV